MMKCCFITVSLILATLVNHAAAGEAHPDADVLRALRNGGQSGAYNYGYLLASQLWQSGNYRCTRDGVIYYFEPDVKSVVYNACQYNYWRWPNRATNCKNGADAFVLQKLSECSTAIDCKEDFGDTAANEVAAVICLRPRVPPPPMFFDPECKEHARIRCYDKVVTLVDDWCPEESPTLSDIKKKCDDMIDSLIGL